MRHQNQQQVPMSMEQMFEQAMMQGLISKMFGNSNSDSNAISVQELIQAGFLDRQRISGAQRTALANLQGEQAASRLQTQGAQRRDMAWLVGEQAAGRLQTQGAQKWALTELMNQAKLDQQSNSSELEKDRFSFEREAVRQDAETARKDAWERLRYEAQLAQEAAVKQQADKLDAQAYANKDARGQIALEHEKKMTAQEAANKAATALAKQQADAQLVLNMGPQDQANRKDYVKYFPPSHYVRQEEEARLAQVPDRAREAMQNMVGTIYSTANGNVGQIRQGLTALRQDLSGRLGKYLPDVASDITPEMANQVFNAIGWDALNDGLEPKKEETVSPDVARYMNRSLSWMR